MTKLTYRLFFLAAIALCIFSCNEEDNSYSIPDTYDFDNVDYSGQLQRLQMLQELKNYLSTANTPGITLDAARLKAMYANDAAVAGWMLTYDPSKQLKDKTLENQRALFESLMEGIAAHSQSLVPGSQGQAGRVASLDGTKQYLLSEKGVEYLQLIEKGLMGACFYYQATAVYLGDERMNVDNETVVPGEGTKMEHHWDEAFGYYGVPRTFPLDKDGIAFWGVYSDRRDPLLACNEAMMSAFRKGRAAISNQDLDTRDEAIVELRNNWELIAGATAISYLNTALNEFDDLALRAHALSEAAAFTYALQFNPEKRLTNAQVNEVLALLGGSADFSEMNFYQLEASSLEQARNRLAELLGLESQMEDF